MSELWATVSAFATPTAVFLLLNCLVALTFIFASRADRLPPPAKLLSHASSFSFSKLIHTSAAPPEENDRVSSHLSPINSFNGDAEEDTLPATDDSASDVAAPPETKRISRAPYLLSRIASFKGLSLRRSAAEESDPPDPVDAQPILLVNRRREESDPAGQRIARADTEPRMKIKFEEAEETKMRRSLSEKDEHETPSSEGEEVDTMADDFINRFKQQLRLQRLDSLLRFRRSAETGE